MNRPDHLEPSPRTLGSLVGALKVLSIYAATLVIAGCGVSGEPTSTTQSSAVRNIIDAYQVASYWQPTPQLDLMSPEGTFVRAALESDAAMGSTRSRAIAYQGFPKPPNMYYKSDYGLEKRISGSYTGGILFTVLDATRPLKSSLEVRVCEVSNTQIPGLPPQRTGTSIMTLVVAKGRVQPPAGQSGPGRRPLGSPFGDWTITSLDYEFPADNQIPDVCDRASLTERTGQPSTPGWPGPSLSTSTSPTS